MKMQSIINTRINKGNVILLLLLCLSYTTVIQAKDMAGIGQYIGAVDFYDVDSLDKKDQVDENDDAVAHDCCHFEQFLSPHLIQNEAGFYLAHSFIRPLTRAPPKVTI